MTPEDAWQEWCAKTERDPQNTLLWATFMSGYESAQARIQELEKALQPFAALGAAYTEHSGAWADEHTVYMFNGIGITLGDIRSASRALHKDSK